MPPKQKITKNDVLNSAFEIVRREGVENLNARNIAKNLHCSTQPIFTCYENMNDLKTDVFEMANRYHKNYFNKIETGSDIFLNAGIAYVEFALEEANLFRFLFMSGNFCGKQLGEFVEDDCNNHIASGMPAFIEKASPVAQAVFTDMWLYAHGIATMLVTNQLAFDKDQIKVMLIRVFERLVENLPNR